MWIKGVNSPIVISAGQSTSAVLCFLLDTTSEEKHGQIRMCLVRASQDGKGAGNPIIHR